MPKLENAYQAKLVTKLRKYDWVMEVVKNNPNYIQGIPDLIVILKNGKWAILEVKRAEDSPHRPNQGYYVKEFGQCGFAKFIFPENEEEVLSELCKYASGTSR